MYIYVNVHTYIYTYTVIYTPIYENARYVCNNHHICANESPPPKNS